MLIGCSTLQGSENVVLQEPEERGKSWEMPSYGQHTATAIVNARQLQMIAQKMAPLTARQGKGGETMHALPVKAELFPKDRVRKGGVTAFSSVPTGDPSRLQWRVI